MLLKDIYLPKELAGLVERDSFGFPIGVLAETVIHHLLSQKEVLVDSDGCVIVGSVADNHNRVVSEPMSNDISNFFG